MSSRGGGHSEQAKKTPLTSSRHEWVALPNAFDQIMTFAREPNLAGKYLNEDLRSGELGSKKVQFSPDGKRTETPLNRSDWEQWTVLVPSLRVHGWDANEGAHLFVRRVDLDRLYPIPATPTKTVAPQSDDVQPPKPRRRKPGPKLKHGWRLEVAIEVYRFREKEGRTPSASELAEYCENKWEWHPDDSDINKLLKYLLDD
jgi:hypothetical protein